MFISGAATWGSWETWEILHVLVGTCVQNIYECEESGIRAKILQCIWLTIRSHGSAVQHRVPMGSPHSFRWGHHSLENTAHCWGTDQRTMLHPSNVYFQLFFGKEQGCGTLAMLEMESPLWENRDSLKRGFEFCFDWACLKRFYLHIIIFLEL